MKSAAAIIFSFGLLLTIFCASAQVIEEDTSTRRTFITPKKFDSKCYAGFEATVGQILRKKAGMTLGFSVNWVINHRFVASAKYHVLTSPLNVQTTVVPGLTGSTILLTHHYGGLGFGYILFHDKKFSFQPELSAGWAAVKHRIEHGTNRQDFAMIIPAVYGTYNASRYFRFGIGLSYRVSAGCKLNGLTDADLSGIGGIAFIRVGTF